MKDKLLVSVIIITKNRPDYLYKCLYYLKKQNYHNCETVVVDSSADQKSKDIVERYGDIKYVRFFNGNNMPISRNLGINASQGEIIAFIDDDSFVHEEWLMELVRYYTDKGIGGVGGAVIVEGGNNDNAGIFSGGVISSDGIIGEYSNAGKEEPIEVDFIQGCNMSFRRDVIHKIGGFDPEFKGTSIMEEIDVCMQVKKSGYKIILSPKAIVNHKFALRGIPRNYDNLRTQYYMKRNHIYMLLKNKGFKLRYIKTFFYWDIVEILKYAKNNFSLEAPLLIFTNLFGKLVGVLLAIRARSKRKDYLKWSGLKRS